MEIEADSIEYLEERAAELEPSYPASNPTIVPAETSYQDGGFVDPAMRVQKGRQLGADYILSGTLRSIEGKQAKQIRFNKKERIYYSLDLTMTDLKTGEIVYADQAELAREASKPIIGW